MELGDDAGVEDTVSVLDREHQDTGQVDVLRELVRHKNVEAQLNFFTVFDERLYLAVHPRSPQIRLSRVLFPWLVPYFREVL